MREGAIDYPKSALQTARDLRAGRGAVALYLNPLAAEDVFRVTAAGEVLPQKSTFFYAEAADRSGVPRLRGRRREARGAARAGARRDAAPVGAARARARRDRRACCASRSAGRRRSAPSSRPTAGPSALRGDVLEASVDSSVWCQQLQLRAPEILAGLRARARRRRALEALASGGLEPAGSSAETIRRSRARTPQRTRDASVAALRLLRREAPACAAWRSTATTTASRRRTACATPARAAPSARSGALGATAPERLTLPDGVA